MEERVNTSFNLSLQLDEEIKVFRLIRVERWSGDYKLDFDIIPHQVLHRLARVYIPTQFTFIIKRVWWCYSGKVVDYQSWGPMFNTRPGQDIPETLCVSHLTGGLTGLKPRGSLVCMYQCFTLGM